MTIRTYDDIRTHIESHRENIELYKQCGMPTDAIKQIEKDFAVRLKKAMREFYKTEDNYNRDPLSVPIRNTEHIWRTVADRYSDGRICGDSCTDFIIIPDHGQTYEELDEYVRYHCPYYYRHGHDFPTGQMITMSTYFTRIPCGIMVVHCRGIDW